MATTIKPIQPVITVAANVTMWINHLNFIPGDSSITTSFNVVSSGVGKDLSGLIIKSSTIGDIATGGGNKVVEIALEVPPGYKVNGVRICYELSSNTTFIEQVRLGQVQNPPSNALVLLDDATHLTNKGPICLNSLSPATPIDPTVGSILLSLRINCGNTADRIVLRGVGLLLVA